MFDKLSYFLRYLLNTFWKYLQGTISLCHWRGYDCLIVVVFLTDFTKQIENYTRTFIGSITKKMACCLSKIMSSSIIDVLDYTPKDSSFEYLRPRGQIIVQIDEKVKVPVLILDFENCPTKFVYLWPHNPVEKKSVFGLR